MKTNKDVVFAIFVLFWFMVNFAVHFIFGYEYVTISNNIFIAAMVILVGAKMNSKKFNDYLNTPLIKKSLVGEILYEGHWYEYEYRLAKDRIDLCLATKNPKGYCNGYYQFSTKDEGNGKAFVITGGNDPEIQDYLKANGTPDENGILKY